MARVKAAVLVSGRGSNLQALMNAAAVAGYPAEIALVVSNEPGAQGLARAARAGIPTSVIEHRKLGTREAFDEALDRALRTAGIDLVCLAGFMRLLTTGFVDAWRDRLINVHPSLLPSFPGLHTHQRALEAGVRFHGCTVHFVRPEVDRGPIIAQAAVPVMPGDDVETLAARVLVAEHRCYPLALRLIAEGRIRVAGNRVVIEGAGWPDEPLFIPDA